MEEEIIRCGAATRLRILSMVSLSHPSNQELERKKWRAFRNNNDSSMNPCHRLHCPRTTTPSPQENLLYYTTATEYSSTHTAQAMMNEKDPPNPAAIACTSTVEAAAVESSMRVMNIFLGGPFDPSEVALRAYTASSSAAAAVKSSEIEKCATATSSTATYNSESDDNDDNDDNGETMPWDRQGWIPIMKSGKQKTPNMVSE